LREKGKNTGSVWILRGRDMRIEKMRWRRYLGLPKPDKNFLILKNFYQVRFWGATSCQREVTSETQT
jgi:hypothetical protein